MVFLSMNSRLPVDQLRREMNQLIRGFLGNVNQAAWPLGGRGRPAVNVWEDEKAVYVELELPGVTNDQVDISVVGDELSIRVERPDVEQEGLTYHRRERAVGSFTRVLRLPSDVEADQVEAELRHGVLNINLPKSGAARPRKIQVATGR